MKTKKPGIKTITGILSFLMLVLVVGACSRQPAVDSITEKDLQIHLEFIASDALMGRQAGEPGSDAAAAYIASYLKKLDIPPWNPDSGYFQMIDSGNRFCEYSGMNFFSITGKSGSETRISDIMLNIYPPEETIVLCDSLVYLGYGTGEGYRPDYSGKIVMVMCGKTGKTNNVNDFSVDGELHKVENLYRNGACQVIYAFNTSLVRRKFRVLCNKIYASGNAMFADDDPANKMANRTIFITDETAMQIVRLGGGTTAEKAFEFKDFDFMIRFERKKSESRTCNVIGFLEGSDPVLKDEYIVYAAHYDHLGAVSRDIVFNGADDNGSGTVAMLEIAEAYMLSPEKPKRSIVFAWMGAEEAGLIGSRYYVTHPPFPLEKTRLCINMDMIGRVWTPSDTGLVYGRKSNVKSEDSLYVTLGHVNRT
ncbi:MAG: M28 family peptidase, partial [Bacteroidota bacterium]